MILGIAFVALVGAAVVMWVLRGRPETAADAFVQQLTQGQMDAAYLGTARSFQQATSGQQFSHIVQRTGLDHAVSTTWTGREVRDDAATLQGEFHVPDGRALPIRIDLGKSGDAWRVLGFQVTGTTGPPEMPVPTEVQQLTDQIMRQFVLATSQRDFSDLYKNIATRWQQEITPADFAASFKEFFDDDLDLTRIVDVPMTLSPRPSIDRDRALDVQGFYATTPSRVHFHLRLVDESGAWRLVSLAVRLDPMTVTPPSAAPPRVAPAHHHRGR